MLLEQRWPNGKITSTIVDHQRSAIRRRRREVGMEETDIEGLAVELDVELEGVVCNCLYKLQPTLNPDYAEVIWRADILGEPRVGTTLNNVTVSDSSRSPSAQETARGNVSDLVPSMASSTMESVTACSGF